jgi:hypothetical protein
MVALQRAIDTPVIFVRYNPDEFKDDKGAHFPKSRGDSRDKFAVELIMHMLARSTERSAPPFDVQLCVAYLNYDGQQLNVPQIFSIDYDAGAIARVPFA